MIALKNSGFSTLNELERHTIATYNAYSKGYNKTRGNRSWFLLSYSKRMEYNIQLTNPNENKPFSPPKIPDPP